jgi:RNA polymerase sigma factor (sigma-70 family)
VDWFLCCACLERQQRAWEYLVAARANRTDTLLIDALRSRAVRLFPRDAEKQDSSVTDFWGYLLAGESEGSLPILARYDGQRPLVPWLIRIFQNKLISEMRQKRGFQVIPDEDIEEQDLPIPASGSSHWHEEFREVAHEWLGGIKEAWILLLGLRLRYRLSQREVAQMLGLHEGNISRHIKELRDDCHDFISARLLAAGWTGDDLADFILKEMDTVLLDEPRLSARHLAALLGERGLDLPPEPGDNTGLDEDED